MNDNTPDTRRNVVLIDTDGVLLKFPASGPAPIVFRNIDLTVFCTYLSTHFSNYAATTNLLTALMIERVTPEQMQKCFDDVSDQIPFTVEDAKTLDRRSQEQREKIEGPHGQRER
jgi:hypothetical protein